METMTNEQLRAEIERLRRIIARAIDRCHYLICPDDGQASECQNRSSNVCEQHWRDWLGKDERG